LQFVLLSNSHFNLQRCSKKSGSKSVSQENTSPEVSQERVEIPPAESETECSFIQAESETKVFSIPVNLSDASTQNEDESAKEVSCIAVSFSWPNCTCWLCSKQITNSLQGKSVGELMNFEKLHVKLIQTLELAQLPPKPIAKLDFLCNDCYHIVNRPLKIICDEPILAVMSPDVGLRRGRGRPRLQASAKKQREVEETNSSSGKIFQGTMETAEVNTKIRSAKTKFYETLKKQSTEKDESLVPVEKLNIKCTGKRKARKDNASSSKSGKSAKSFIQDSNVENVDDKDYQYNPESNDEDDDSKSDKCEEVTTKYKQKKKGRKASTISKQKKSFSPKIKETKGKESTLSEFSDSELDDSTVPVVRERIEFSQFFKETAVCVEICVDNIFSVAAAVAGGAQR